MKARSWILPVAAAGLVGSLHIAGEAHRIREMAIGINAELVRVVPNPLLINVGTAEGAGDGDALWVALMKVRNNFKQLPDYKGHCEWWAPPAGLERDTGHMECSR